MLTGNDMGAFAIYNEAKADSTLISNLFIDEYMKDANDAQIKIYLYLVRQMSAGLTTSISEMADLFNHTEREVLRSLKYWEKKGLLVLETDAHGTLSSIHLCELHRQEAANESHVISILPKLEPAAASETEQSLESGPKEEPSAPPKKKVSRPVCSAEDMVRKRELLFIVEQYIGKPLSPSEIQSICYMTDQLHFSDELVDYLVAYCVGLGKKDFRYIEKVALNWAEQGITTAGQAQKAVYSTRKKKRAPSGKVSNSFNKIEQHDYNFAEIEEQILR